MPTSRQDLISALKEDLHTYFDANMLTAAAAPQNLIFSQENTIRNVETIGGMNGTGSFPAVAEGETFPERKPFERAEATFIPEKRGMIVPFTEEAVADSTARGHDAQAASRDWAQMFEVSKDRQAVTVLTSTANGYDGDPLFSASHPQRSLTTDGSSFSNIITSGAGLGITDDTFKAAQLRLEDTNAFNEILEEVDVFASHLIATTQDRWYEAKIVLESIGQSGTADNDKNAVQGEVVPILWRRLNEAANPRWFLVKAKVGFAYMMRQNVQISTWFDENSDVFKAKIKYRGIADYFDWRQVVRTQFS